MPEPLLYLKAMAAAAIVSIIIVLATRASRLAASSTWLNSACIFGIGAGLTVGYSVLAVRWVWPPLSGLDRFLMIGLPAALVVEWIAGFPWVPRQFAWFLRLSLAAAVPRILLHGSVYLSGHDWPPWQAGAAMAICGGLLAVSWSLLVWLSRRSPGVSIPMALVLTTLCAGLTVMMAGYLQGGAAAFPLAATVLATAIASSLMPMRSVTMEWSEDPALLGIGIVGLFSLLFIGVFFGRLPTVYALAMWLAPLWCWGTETPRLRHQKPWLVGSIRLVLVAIPLVLVLMASKRNFDREMAPLLGELWKPDSASNGQ